MSVSRFGYIDVKDREIPHFTLQFYDLAVVLKYEEKERQKISTTPGIPAWSPTAVLAWRSEA